MVSISGFKSFYITQSTLVSERANRPKKITYAEFQEKMFPEELNIEMGYYKSHPDKTVQVLKKNHGLKKKMKCY